MSAHAPDTQQFAELFVRNQRRIYGFILTIVPHAADADELFQETSLIIWQKIGEFAPAVTSNPADDFVRWATAIAFNVIRNWRVARQRDRHQFSDALITAIADRRAERGDELDARLAALAGCLDKLPDPERSLLQSCYDDSSTITQVAHRLHLDRNVIYQRLHRIRRALLQCISRTLSPEASR